MHFPYKNAISCAWEHAVKGTLDHLGIQIAAWSYNCLTNLSQVTWLLVMWRIPNLMLQVGQKQEVAHRLVWRTRRPRLITPFTHRSGHPNQFNTPFLLIFDIFKNVNPTLNAVITANSAFKWTCYVSKFKLDITEYSGSCCNVISLLLLKICRTKEEYFLLGHLVHCLIHIIVFKGGGGAEPSTNKLYNPTS